MSIKLIGTTILLAVFSSFPLSAQSSKPDPSAPANQSSTQDEDRPVSWKLVAPNILNGQKAIWLFPAKIGENHNWIPTLSVVSATAGLVLLDSSEGRYFHNTSSFQGLNHVFTGNATGWGIVIAPVSLYAIGLVGRNPRMQHTALLAGEAVADA